MTRTLFATVLALLAATVPVMAQAPLLTQGAPRGVPLGFCSILAGSVAAALRLAAKDVLMGTSRQLAQRSTRTLLATFLVLIATTAASLAQAPMPTQGAPRGVPLGFCSIPDVSAPVPLASCPGGIPPTANFAVICAYTVGVDYRDDGTAPTGTVGAGGQGIAAGSCINYGGPLAAIQFIEQPPGGAVLGVSFYYGAAQ